VKFGFVVPFADTREFTELAAIGEQHGWDAVFTWESLYGVDAWITLGAAAMVTERIRLGTLLTPVSRHRPWDLASRVSTVDRLSNGRAILGAGLGALHEGWLAFEADEGRRARAEKLDESLAIFAGLLRGQPFSYTGAHYSARPTTFVLPPPPVQRPHPPVWVVGAYVPGRDRQRSLERAARWNGLLPVVAEPGTPSYTLESFAEVVGRVGRLREQAGTAHEPYDVVVEADSSGEFVQLAGTVGDWEKAGATWWVESWWSVEPGAAGLAEVRRRILAGPPHS
jgi:alkanesulfonate monooxygenase SsuD/methylene tetrahydromethanopterin reductase-like flavin-dependent oxidoreductase (luciferase family)